jgi:membrane associated rhomboid family serine protease
VLRRTSGSSLCYRCGRLNRVDADRCFYCGARRPGLWGWGHLLGRLGADLDVARLVIAVCAIAYVAALGLDPGAVFRSRGLFNLLAPSNRALVVLGMTGAIPWAAGYWWTLLTAIYLHGSLLHILFNALWIRQLGPAVEEFYGRPRTFLIFTASGVAGFVLSNALGIAFTVGASGAVFGLLGAMVHFGRSRGGVYGLAIFRQYWQWALVLFVMGFLMPGVNNAGHAGGFLGGYLAALLLGHNATRPERGWHALAAVAAAALTALAFALALWTGFGP